MKNKLFSYIFSFSLILCLLLSGINFCCFNRPFYNWQHSYLKLADKRLPEYIGTTDEGLADLTDFLLKYLEDDYDSLDHQMEIKGQVREVFNEKEKTHMVDVKNLYITVMNVRNIAFFTALASMIISFVLNKKKGFVDLFVSYKKTLIVYGAFILGIGVACIVDFDAFWTQFHHVFFPTNDLWILSLRTDILIMIVPPDFFNNLIYFIILTIVTSLVIAYFLLRLSSRKAAAND